MMMLLLSWKNDPAMKDVQLVLEFYTQRMYRTQFLLQIKIIHLLLWSVGRYVEMSRLF